MENKESKKGQYLVSINQLSDVTDDPTIKRAKVSVFDFNLSGNGQIITEEVARENIHTLIGKRITCQYIPREANGGVDALGDHGVDFSVDRNGDLTMVTDTTAVGFIENAYIENDAVYADVVLWADDKYADIVGLLDEWIQRGININMSVEYYYYNYNLKDGIEYIQSPIYFNGHTLLNSEDRGEVATIRPAYECAKLLSMNDINKYNKVVNNLESKNNKEGAKVDLEKLQAELETSKNELEASKNELEKVKGELEASKNDLVKANEELESSKNKINELNEKVISLNEELGAKATELETAKTEAEKSINELNEKIEAMKPIVDKYNEEQFEKAFNEKSEYYKEKFNKVNALEVFEEDSTQELIKQSVNSDEAIAKEAMFSLNSLIVENINISLNSADPVVEEGDESVLNGTASISINSVIPEEGNSLEETLGSDYDIFADKYGIKYE